MTTTPRPTTSARINPDNRVMLAGLLLVLVAVAAASFTLSFTGLSAAAPWVALPAPLAWLVPVVLEVAMLVYVGAALLRAHRGQSARLAWTLVWVLTTVSSAINAAHAWDAGPQGWQGAVGAALAGMFPFMTLAAAHVVVDVAFTARPDIAAATDADTATVADTVAATDADTKATSASAGQADAPAVVGDVAPIALDGERAPELHAVDTETTDTRTDSGHPDSVRTLRTAARGRVAEHREEIVRLALTTDLSGRAIADRLGLGRTVVCPVVTQARAGRTGIPSAMLDVAVGSSA
ncbi:DUF2637 domain-containing protein [Cellulosimicrobium cellulans]|uniref:DUF2637 domain-containing protein n=1 Tax=Cellulosimicrobium cellulans TaxID=1710 RepID=UPI0019653B39|nr:DUF2637 domain-containing protein [Cellulosimicrobium cellulans]MBN0039407.1 DUF2637 domain-containing protein [Cellulosimicrobium cellulans]